METLPSTTGKHHPGSKGTDVMNTRTTEESKEYRKEVIEAARVLIGKGYTYQMKVQALSTQFNVSIRQAKTYLKWTRQDIKKRKQERDEDDYDEVMIQYKELFRQMMAQNKLADAANVLDKYSKLKGFIAPTKHIVAHDVNVRQDYSHMSEDKILQILSIMEGENEPGTSATAE